MENESEKKRTERKRQRELKNARKKELSEATSASERRQIKAKYSEPKEKSNEGKSEGNTVADRMSQREAEAGLNNTMSGRGQPMPTMSEREAAAGLYDTTVGGDSFYDSDIEPSAPESPSQQVLYPDGDSFAGFGGVGSGDTNTFVLDVVKDDNTAGTATFNGTGIN
tara:strand:+ start:660 stop:1160 length:501 start_codon:yes stop_codon:yes gene_type:complete